ncbi:rhomboid-like protein 20 isoform X4 [Brachypodium distachyon]|uniref:rhomboid-like protein 20 isoform X4 n=1 Tax=Brachypodium distachyon TaxID=15368 RepID=UPI000D0D7042|nr:rhomboid-like protein 20 isoform X4 [Brachypodium distachyon]|eukprot:XP_024316034.1 rhomboid-like protein 20 isoform X4 [Brachypodium distachyon]
MSGGLPGFHNAPVSRAVVVAAALFSVPFGFRGRFLDLGLSYQNVYEKLHIWKLITSLFAFSSTPELIFGVALLYYFRVFERQIGSNKYAVFIVFSTTVSVLLQILALGYLKGLQVPDFATSLFSRFSWPFANISYQRLPVTRTDENIPYHQARQMEGVPATTPDPVETSISTLVSMGFDRASAIQALALTNNDVNLASNILLEAQST